MTSFWAFILVGFCLRCWRMRVLAGGWANAEAWVGNMFIFMHLFRVCSGMWSPLHSGHCCIFIILTTELSRVCWLSLSYFHIPPRGKGIILLLPWLDEHRKFCRDNSFLLHQTDPWELWYFFLSGFLPKGGHTSSVLSSPSLLSEGPFALTTTSSPTELSLRIRAPQRSLIIEVFLFLRISI